MNYLGFDSSAFPGLEAMAQLRRHFAFCGFYLPAPSHQDGGWTGHRAALVEAGWGLAPVFVGREVVGPGSHLVDLEHGELDGHACNEAMRAEGFPVGARVYLDLENGLPFPAAQQDYVRAWLTAMAAGGYRGGVYCSHMLAPHVADVGGFAPLWVFKVPTVARTAISAAPIAPNPALSGYSKATIWQFRQNVILDIGDLDLVVDLNSAIVADPSSV